MHSLSNYGTKIIIISDILTDLIKKLKDTLTMQMLAFTKTCHPNTGNMNYKYYFLHTQHLKSCQLLLSYNLADPLLLT